MQTASAEVKGLKKAIELLKLIAAESQWFAFMLLPDDEYRITVKVENAGHLTKWVSQAQFAAIQDRNITPIITPIITAVLNGYVIKIVWNGDRFAPHQPPDIWDCGPTYQVFFAGKKLHGDCIPHSIAAAGHKLVCDAVTAAIEVAWNALPATQRQENGADRTILVDGAVLPLKEMPSLLLWKLAAGKFHLALETSATATQTIPANRR